MTNTSVTPCQGLRMLADRGYMIVAFMATAGKSTYALKSIRKGDKSFAIPLHCPACGIAYKDDQPQCESAT